MSNICQKCNKSFKFNYLLVKHLNNKKPCDRIDNVIKSIDKKIEIIDNKLNEKYENNLEYLCNYCNNNYNNKSNLNRHLKSYCKVKNTLIEEKNNLIIEKNKIIKSQEEHNKDDIINALIKENEELKTKNNQKETNINNGTINNINNNTINININSFGNENLSHLTTNDFKKMLTSHFKGLKLCIEKIHFNDDMPENHNIYLAGPTSKYIRVYENNKWTLKQRDDIVDKLISSKYTLLNDKCEELEEQGLITDKVVDEFYEFTNNYRNGGEESEKNLKEDVKLLVAENRDKVKKILN